MKETDVQKSNEGANEERYIGGYSSLVTKEILAKRTASLEASFFLPHLRPGMRLLDCGCGPGTITVNLAEVVAPGEVVGIDIEDKQFEIGRANARERGVSNVRFETGNIYDLPFPSDTFDAVFAHAVLYHLKTPRKALIELHRILKPGGVIAIRDLDNGGTIFTPSSQILDKALELIGRVLEYNGGNSLFGRSQRAILREVGFVNIQVSASYDSYGTAEATRGVGKYLADLILQPRAVSVITEQQWASQSELEEMGAAFKAWGEHSDAFWARARCEAVGWKE
jgi:ubiquinone/menaquinone biosynthesis C-methylase UbiE